MPASIDQVRSVEVGLEKGVPSSKQLVKHPIMGPGSLVLKITERRLLRVLERIKSGPPQLVRELALAKALLATTRPVSITRECA